MDKINWFWAHRRNASLHHFSFLMHGLSNKGWLPTVDFWFDNQIVVGVPEKGCFIFYDKAQLKSGAKFKDIQDSIDNNSDFVQDFRRRTDELFGAVFFKCINIDLENLQLLSDQEVSKLYKDFIQTITVAPIITVQLWGIEACFDDNYKITSFLRQRLQELGKTKDFEEIKGLLQVNVGETVAFSEQKNFYQVAVKIMENMDVKRLFESNDLKIISEKLKEFEFENHIFEKHIQKYEWISTEYVSTGWSREKWIELFKNAVTSNIPPERKLSELIANFEDLNNQRRRALEELNPPADVLLAIDALAEFIAQRDWTKGYFTRILISYHKLLNEIARRFNVEFNDLLQYSYIELVESLSRLEPLDKEEINKRKNHGFVIVIKRGQMRLVSGKQNIDLVIKEEDISEPFEKVINVNEFKGLAASRGVVKGKARVIEDASTIPQLKPGEILVTYMTTIEFIPAFRKAVAVITDEGGISCHAAIISREFNLPCIVGTKIATRVLRTGDMIEVDADNGVVRILGKGT